MVVLEEVPVGEWREAETFWIAYFRSIGANVINQTDGGQGFTPDSETRERWLRSVRAAVERPEHREKMRRINAEYWADPANRARHSKKMQRVYRDPEKRKRMVEASQAAMRGRRRKPRPTPAE
jgi:hypothetical protein